MTSKQLFIGLIVWVIFWSALAAQVKAVETTVTVTQEVIDEISMTASVPCNPQNCDTEEVEEVETVNWLGRAIAWLRAQF